MGERVWGDVRSGEGGGWRLRGRAHAEPTASAHLVPRARVCVCGRFAPRDGVCDGAMAGGGKRGRADEKLSGLIKRVQLSDTEKGGHRVGGGEGVGTSVHIVASVRDRRWLFRRTRSLRHANVDLFSTRFSPHVPFRRICLFRLTYRCRWTGTHGYIYGAVIGKKTLRAPKSVEAERCEGFRGGVVERDTHKYV